MPTPESVLGFPLGIGQPQPVTSAQIVSYVQAVDAASDRVISFDIGTTWGGRPLKVAIVSSREHMRPAELRRIRERFVALREGRGGATTTCATRPRSCGSPATCTAARRAAPTPS